MPNKQLKMLLGWAAVHQEELKENWYLARQKEELFAIDPLRQVKRMIEPNIKKYFENPRKLIDITTGDGYKLFLTFDNGEKKVYDMHDQLQGVFEVLEDKNKFNTVFIDEFGNAAWDIDENVDSAVCWNNRIDICKDALYLDSRIIEQLP